MAALGAVFVLAGCTSDPADPVAPSATTAAPPATTTAPGTTGTACQTVAGDAQELLAQLTGLATRESTVADVQAAAATLRQDLDSAKATLGPEARADLDRASAALQRVQTALTASPIDTAGLRAGAQDLASALGDAARVCGESGVPSTIGPGTPTS